MTEKRFDWTQEEQEVHREERERLENRRPVRRIWRRMTSLVLVAALFGTVSGACFYGVNQLASGADSAQSSETASLSQQGVLTTLSSTSGTSARYGMDVTDIAEIALPCVVSVTNISVQEVHNYFNRFGYNNGFTQPQLEETTSCGSGVIICIDEAGDALYIVTNAHVVEEATTLSVSFVDNSVYEAQLCGTDEDLDLAVLKVALSDLSEETLEQIDVIAIGDSDALEVGEQVVAIGNALGYGQSVTTGIVSALNRSLTSEGTSVSYIQTDAAINPGNSGGALLNLDGELVGINTAKLSSTDVEGMGYAIPISDVIDVIAELMTQTTTLAQPTAQQSSSGSTAIPYSRW
jgi:serine protease Do